MHSHACPLLGQLNHVHVSNSRIKHTWLENDTISTLLLIICANTPPAACLSMTKLRGLMFAKKKFLNVELNRRHYSVFFVS